jgi:hypothetical protein
MRTFGRNRELLILDGMLRKSALKREADVRKVPPFRICVIGYASPLA